MRITERQLRKIVREAMEIVNYDTGEVVNVDQLPPKYAGRIVKDKEHGHNSLYDSDFRSLLQDIELNPDEALDRLSDLASGNFEDESRDMDLSVAIDSVMGLKHSYPKEWKAALKSNIIQDMYYEEDDAMRFEDLDDALATWLAERYS